MSFSKGNRLLIVDDDSVFRERLALSMGRRTYEVRTASSAEEAIPVAKDFTPQGALVDLKMPGESGLILVQNLKDLFPDIRIVILTGYGSIATAMEAVRLGAADYLTKPADPEKIEQALLGKSQEAKLSVPSLDQVEWEHLQRVLSDCKNNVSQAARVLGIERRSLQRKLAKFAPHRSS